MGSRTEENTIVNKLLTLDARIIYVIVLACLTYPLINPIGLPLPIDPLTIAFKNEVDALKPGDLVVVMVDMEQGVVGDVGPGSIVFMNEIFAKPGVKFIQVCFYRADAPIIFDTQVMPYVDQKDKVYGEDWVNIGYIEGAAAAQAAFAADFHLSNIDVFGTPLEEIPLMKEARSMEDAVLVVQFGSGSAGKMQMMAMPYNKRFISGVTSMYFIMERPEVDAGLIHGMLNGMKGGAEYEFLTKRPGRGVAGMDSISLQHSFLIVIALIANVLYIYQRYVKGEV
jgi:hypothetical protein